MLCAVRYFWSFGEIFIKNPNSYQLVTYFANYN